MNKLREVMLETPEVLDNARLTADGRNLYLIKTRVRTSDKNNKARSPWGAGLVCLTGIPIRRAETEPVS